MALFGRLEVDVVRLNVPGAGDDGTGRFAQLDSYWDVMLKSSDGARYHATIEPFGGTVTSLYRVKAGFQLPKLK